MSWLTEGIERDKIELQELFNEKLEFEFHDLGKTYSKLKLLKINGVPVHDVLKEFNFKNLDPKKAKCVFYFYKNDIYINPDKKDRDYKGSLMGYDMYGQPYTARYFYENQLKKSTFRKLNMIDVLKELYC